MRILSIQSGVASGTVGNKAACFVLQRLGAEVARVDTASLSHPPGLVPARGRIIPAAELADVFEGLHACGALDGIDAVLSGYLGSAENGACMMAALAALRARRPKLVYACDPVIGDHGRVYVAPDLVGFFAGRAMGQADILTPNAFELGHLSGCGTATLPEVLAAGEALRGRMLTGGRKILLATGLKLGRADALHFLLLAPEGRFTCAVPRHEGAFSGAGDVFAALFLFRLLKLGSAATALGQAAGAMAALMAASGTGVLPLVAAQAAWAGAVPALALQAV